MNNKVSNDFNIAATLARKQIVTLDIKALQNPEERKAFEKMEKEQHRAEEEQRQLARDTEEELVRREVEKRTAASLGLHPSPLGSLPPSREEIERQARIDVRNDKGVKLDRAVDKFADKTLRDLESALRAAQERQNETHPPEPTASPLKRAWDSNSFRTNERPWERTDKDRDRET